MGAEPGLQAREPGAAGGLIRSGGVEAVDGRSGGIGMGNAMPMAQAAAGSQPALLKAALQHELSLKPGPRPATGADDAGIRRAGIRRTGNRSTRDENSQGQPPT